MTTGDNTTERRAELFFEEVQHRAPNIESVSEAKTLTQSVLSVLADSISAGQMAKVLKELPDELVPHGSSVDGNAHDNDELGFVEMLTARSDSTDPALAEARARGVLSTLRAWVGEQQISDTLAQLPLEVRELFDAPAD